MDLTTIIKHQILGQEAYEIEERTGRIKLDANENPHLIPDGLKQKFLERLAEIELHRYPVPGSPELRRKFAEKLHVHESTVMIGNGSDELIFALVTAMRVSSSGGVVIPVPTFGMYRIASLNTGHRVMEVPLDDRFDLDVDAMMREISEDAPAMIFLSYPNNPTGNCFSPDRMEEILRSFPGIVVVDEAYYPFAERTFLSFLDEFRNLVILRSLSKIGFAALRLGILIADPVLVRELNKIRLPYNINSFSQAAAAFYLEHEDDFQEQVEWIIKERQWLWEQLQAIQGIRPYRSDANFILFSCFKNKDSVYEKLVDHGIIIKNFGSSGLLRDCFRVTVGTESENREFVDALKGALEQ